MAKRLSTILKHAGKPNKDANYSIYCDNKERIKHFVLATRHYEIDDVESIGCDVTSNILLVDLIQKIASTCDTLQDIVATLPKYKLSHDEDEYIKCMIIRWYVDVDSL